MDLQQYEFACDDLTDSAEETIYYIRHLRSDRAFHLCEFAHVLLN